MKKDKAQDERESRTTMNYIFKGKLCGYICAECWEPLEKVKVRLYRSRSEQNVAALAVAAPKDTFAILSDEETEAKASSLIAEVETDDSGQFVFELGEKERYSGEAFEIDVYCGTVPHRPPGRTEPKPLQFSITTIHPMWRETDRGFVAGWEYCIPWRYWCLIRARCGAWTICGRVTICGTNDPAVGVKVRAFDVDWLQDDDLGSGVTDANGNFRIDYLADDFKKTIFPTVFVEWTGGPDLYFQIESAGGAVLLAEPRSKGRSPGRENVGPCFCVELCVDVAPTPPFDNPLFTHIGDFHIITDILPTGLTIGPRGGHAGTDYGFFSAMKLRGFCPKVSPIGAATAMRYRFLYATLADPGTLIPITGGSVYPVLVGSRLIQWKLVGDTLAWTFQSIWIQGAGATADPTPTPGGVGPWGAVPDHVIVPDANGWIAVDQNGLDAGFYGPLIRFNSSVAIPGGAAPGSGAGNAVPVAQQKNGVPVRIIFEAKRVSDPDPAPPLFTNERSPVVVNNWSDVNEINLTEFTGPGNTPCSGLTTDLHIQYTADHELMAAWSLGISTAATPNPVPVLPSGNVPRGVASTLPLDISLWPKCSYTVSLSTRRKLTDGEIDDSGHTNSLTFCKK